MMAPKRLRNSFTMTPESMPAGAFTAVTDDPANRGEQLQPHAVTAARVASASNCAFSISLPCRSA